MCNMRSRVGGRTAIRSKNKAGATRQAKVAYPTPVLVRPRPAGLTPGAGYPHQPIVGVVQFLMPLYVIPFPAIDPVLVSIGPIAIRWYALAYIVGILLGWVYARAIVAREQLWGGPAPLTVTDYDDFVLWVTLGIILGGRIGYVLFYNPIYFAA